MQFNQNFPLDFQGDNQMLQMQQQPGPQSQMQSDNGPMPLPGATAPSFMNYGASAPQLQETQFRKGGNVSFADVAAKGRYGDTMLAHINPQEAMMLKQMGGSGTINPETGQPEFFFMNIRSRMLEKLKQDPQYQADLAARRAQPGYQEQLQARKAARLTNEQSNIQAAQTKFRNALGEGADFNLVPTPQPKPISGAKRFFAQHPKFLQRSQPSQLQDLELGSPEWLQAINTQGQSPLVPTSNWDSVHNRRLFYKEGGQVNELHRLAEKVRSKGRNGDTMLAHINPQEAMMLKQMGGSGTINPETGQPEFFFRGVRHFFKNPGKTIGKTFKNPKRTIADLIALAGTVAGAVTGNPYLAAAAGAARVGIRQDKGRRGWKDYLTEGAKHAGYASLGNMAANASGGGAYVAPEMSWTTPFSLSGPTGASSVGPMGAGSAGGVGARATAVEKGGTNLGSRLGVSAGDAATKSSRAPINYDNITKEQLNKMTPTQIQDALSRKQAADVLVNKSLFEKASDYLMRPEVLTSLGSAGLNLYNTATQKKPKEKSPEELAGIQKRYSNSLRLTPAELAAQQAYFRDIDNTNSPLLTQPQTKNTYRRTHTPEEYNQTGRWFSHYDNPQFSGMSLYKKGGKVKPKVIIEEMQVDYPMSASFLDGHTKGQDDKIPALLSDGEYVIDAATVSDLGDGNSNAGAKILDQFRDSIRKHKRGGKVGFPPKAKSPMDYMR